MEDIYKYVHLSVLSFHACMLKDSSFISWLVCRVEDKMHHQH